MTCDRKIGPFDCCSVVCGDCLELMKQLPDGCVDAVITSPPYVAQRVYHGGFPLDKDGWLSWLLDILTESLRIGTSAVFNIGDRRRAGVREWDSADFAGLARQRGFPLWERFIWVKYPYLPNGSAKQPDDIVEFVLCFGKPLFNTNAVRRPYSPATLTRYQSPPSLRHLSDGTRKSRAPQTAHDGGSRPTTVLTCGALSTEEFTGHPAQYPLEIPAWFTAAMSTDGQIILDPFCGSGTTLIAAKKLGRHFLGFEISEEYCQIARDRLARIDAQPSLFQPKPEQLELGGTE